MHHALSYIHGDIIPNIKHNANVAAVIIIIIIIKIHMYLPPKNTSTVMFSTDDYEYSNSKNAMVKIKKQIGG